MTLDADALPDAPPPLADYAGVSTPSMPPSGMDAMAQAPAATPNGLPADLGRISAELAEIQKKKNAADDAEARTFAATRATDKARMDKAYAAAGIGPDDLKPWDADANREKYKTDPIESFGSLGSVFAIIASQFTNRPMENAMYGAAAAMNAVKEGNDLQYDRAFKAWHENSNLAIKRQNIQNAQFQNASTLSTTNMAAGREAMRINAVQAGDKAALFYMENGLDEKLMDLYQKRVELTPKMANAVDDMAVAGMKSKDLLARVKGLTPGSPEFQQAVTTYREDWTGQKYDEDKEWARRRRQQFPDESVDEWGKAFQKYKNKTLDANLVTNKGQAWANIYTTELAKNPGNTALAAEIANRSMSEKASDHKDAVTSATNIIDSSLKKLKAAKESGAFTEKPTGIPGMLNRFGETVGYIDNQISHEFEQDVKAIQQILPRAMPGGARGRMLKGDRADYDTIVPGLGRLTNVDASINGLERLKAIINKQDLMDEGATSQKEAIPVPERLKNELDGTRVPQKSTGRIFIKRGDKLVPE